MDKDHPHAKSPSGDPIKNSIDNVVQPNRQTVLVSPPVRPRGSSGDQPQGDDSDPNQRYRSHLNKKRQREAAARASRTPPSSNVDPNSIEASVTGVYDRYSVQRSRSQPSTPKPSNGHDDYQAQRKAYYAKIAAARKRRNQRRNEEEERRRKDYERRVRERELEIQRRNSQAQRQVRSQSQ